MPLREILYPQLRGFDPAERAEALRRAREAPFDVVELVGTAFGLVVAASLTAHGGGDTPPLERALAALANFLLALPILAVLVGPFLVRHVRRGLEGELRRREGRAGP